MFRAEKGGTISSLFLFAFVVLLQDILFFHLSGLLMLQVDKSQEFFQIP